MYDDTIENSFWHTRDYLALCANNGIVASDKKFQFCKDTVDFAGLTITNEGVAPSENILTAIQNFPTPTNIIDARSWFGLVNQVSWAYSVSPLMQPFRDLIKPNEKFYWDYTLNQLFEKSKLEIINAVKDGVKSFSLELRTCLQTDWSKNGIGYLLLQQHCKCDSDKIPTCCETGWQLIFAGSRFTNPAESRYSPTEGEALALVWSLHHSRMFTQGCKSLVVSVDHKPLLGIFNDRELSSITNPRLQNLKEKSFGWDYKITYNPAKWHRGPDAMSRNPVSLVAFIRGHPTDSDFHLVEEQEECMQACTIAALNNLPKCSITIDDIISAGQLDDSYSKLKNAIEVGFPPSRNDTDPVIRNYWQVRHRLSFANGVMMMDHRIVIPIPLRKLILENLHSAHQGVTSMKSRANHCVYWPGMENSIQNYHNTCTSSTCVKYKQSQHVEPLIITPIPEWPFQKICLDYFFVEQHSYLVVADRYSSWPCVYYFKPGEATSSLLINSCRDIFTNYGVPEEISSDGGPQFVAKSFKYFLHQWGVRHRISSVSYAQSNGRAESAVKSAKRMIRDNISSNGTIDTNKVAKAILQYRNTPLHDCNLSPAQILFHRQLRDSIPFMTNNISSKQFLF